MFISHTFHFFLLSVPLPTYIYIISLNRYIFKRYLKTF
nr:MAG TPA: hypothetical protein [Caudoviricetes sp.]